MAEVNANIDVNIDTSNALSQLKSLQRQISQFHTSISKSSEAAALAQRDLQKNFINSVNSIGAFSAELRTVKSTAESFTDSLEKNKFSMREYFRFASGATKTFGRFFRSEFETVNKVAEENVKRLQTQYIKMGRDATGAMRAIAVMPNQLDMSNVSTQLQMAAQRQAIFNQLLKQGSTNLLNFGKNTQWAGRQLMVGFTLPLATLGATASRTFMEMESAALKFRKVYGDLFTPAAERQQALDDITALGEVFTRYGISVAQTVNLAADAAAAGFQGLDLQRQVTEATRLQVLGQIDQQKALETTISLQSAFKLSNEDLSESINFLNAVENQTVVSLDDITTAIPKVAPVIMQLGGDVKDLAFFMTAMKQGGVNASEGANALKSGLASLINPTDKAAAMLKGMGINMKEIVESNKGDLKATVIEFAQALDTLDPLTRARAIEQLFGKFQFARLSTLFENVTAEGTQAARVLELAGYSAEDLASTAESELGMSAESSMNKFRSAVEQLRLALVPVGQVFLESVVPILEFFGNILEKFNNLSAGVKKAITVITIALGAIAPVALMTFGLISNFVANGIKGFMLLRNGYLRLTGQSQVLGEQTQYLTMEQQNALAVAHSLDQSHARLIQTFTVEAGAVQKLSQAYERAMNAGMRFAQANPGMMQRPLPGFKSGILSVPGSGTEDKYPAMLAAGEAIIPAKLNKKYAPLIQGIIADNIPGFRKGRAGQFAHVTGRQETNIGAILDSLEALPQSVKEARSGLIDLVRDVVSTFGRELKAFKYSGLGFEQSDELNRAMAKNRPVSASGFLQDFESRGLKKWDLALQYANTSTENVADELRIYDARLTEAVRSIVDLNQNATITSSQFEAIEREVRATLPEFSQLRQALNVAESTMTEFRFNPSQSQARAAGLTSYKVPSATDPTKMSTKPRVRLASGREMRLGGEHGYINVPGAFDVEEAIHEIKRSAGTQSPSKKTIPIGEDIARGLQVGMQNQMDETSAAGQALSGAAVSGVRKGRRGATSPGGTVGAGGIIVPPVIPTVASGADNGAGGVGRTTTNLAKLNSTLMGVSFAMTSVSGITSAFGGRFQGLSEAVFKVSGLLFGLMSVVQLLTQEMFANVVAARANKVATAMGAAGGFKGLMAGATGFGSKLLTLGKFLVRFAGPIGAVIAGLTATVSIIKMVNAAREREKQAIEGLGNVAVLTKEKLKSLGDFFGVVPSKLPFERAQGRALVGPQTRTRLDQLVEETNFTEVFKKDIEALRSAAGDEAQMVLQSLAVQLKGRGFAEDQIKLIVQALTEQAGRTDVKIDFKSLNLAENSSAVEQAASIAGQKIGRALASGVQKRWGDVKWVELDNEAKQQIDTASKSIGGMVQGVIGQFEQGSINSDQFKQQIDSLSAAISKMPQATALSMISGMMAQLGPDVVAATSGITNQTNKLQAYMAISLGVISANSVLLKELASTDADVREGAVIDLKKLMNSYYAEIEKAVKEEGTVGEKVFGDGEKSAFQKAIEQLKEQRKELNNTVSAYGKLRKSGMDAGQAFEYAKDPIIAAALETTKVGTKKWKELLSLIKEVDKKARDLALQEFFDTRTEDINLKKQFAEVVPLLEKIGLESEDIQEILSNPDLMRKFIKDLRDGVINSKQLQKYIDEIPEEKRINIKLGISDAESEFEKAKEKAGELFDFLRRAAEREYKPLIIKAEKEVDNAQKTLDKVNDLIDDEQDKIDDRQRTIEEKISRPIEALQEGISDLQRDMEIRLDRPIEEFNKQIAALERSIEEQFNRPIGALQEESSDIANDLSLIDKAAESINEKYDLQAEALDKVAQANQEIINQQKQQIGLADALSRGDIAAAAQSIQEMRASSAAASAASSRDMLDAARKAELSGLRGPVSGLTREQIEERQFQIGQQIFALEERRESVQAQILAKQDQIYLIEQGRAAILDAIRIKENDIYDLEEKEKQNF